ncbi:MAG: hypothetical protein EWV55_05670 [Microcystis viridis Mv_BB_P_19951000_S69]|jgi:hypothetical protein|uniref:Uncharacterized protein n=1 Tax=Microcystis viridis Mv_BB_P_19951000_S68D TaxID=2486270 RepID=A0A552H918_MICVR|nr:hypothetical protein [Microcystis aeruginosa]TRU67744.1 MAG: hypothetical protein EWV77_22010 [Microcystis viridis Mv_BB_P_19951000_S68D]TRU73735.1 MAG: hypothetical protein EWV47_12385 [Microcystis viridis Mv_BB_P_19951000_S68]TRU77114.1 MAG: hypothetical protein EWV55_05670 [Microcystis viridis Mv_BB_P_19951000_S69]TRU80628.1 MAG: hypothetical protein EWV46_23060 [Microcystis viridis Mv_BB_P_19951000_S69D]MDB9422084.1 hypothetical protein [Microcystis aeruginosa CS-563/04]
MTTLPSGSWSNSSSGSQYTGTFGSTSTITALLSSGSGDPLLNATACYNSGDSFSNSSGSFQFSTIGSTTAGQIPGGSWSKSAYNPIWCPVSQLVVPCSTFPYIRDIGGQFQSISNSNLVYLCATLGGNSSFPQTTIALTSYSLNNSGSLFTLSGSPTPGANITTLPSLSISWPGGSWESSSVGSWVVSYYGNYLLIANLKTGSGSNTRVACTTFSPGDTFNNVNGYFQYSSMSNNTKYSLPQGSWINSAYDVMWAPVSQFLASGLVVPTGVSGTINSSSCYSSYVSCYLDNGATTATTFFGSVPQNLSNSNGLLTVQTSNNNSNFWLNFAKDILEIALDAAEIAAE